MLGQFSYGSILSKQHPLYNRIDSFVRYVDSKANAEGINGVSEASSVVSHRSWTLMM